MIASQPEGVILELHGCKESSIVEFRFRLGTLGAWRFSGTREVSGFFFTHDDPRIPLDFIDLGGGDNHTEAMQVEGDARFVAERNILGSDAQKVSEGKKEETLECRGSEAPVCSFQFFDREDTNYLSIRLLCDVDVYEDRAGAFFGGGSFDLDPYDFSVFNAGSYLLSTGTGPPGSGLLLSLKVSEKA